MDDDIRLYCEDIDFVNVKNISWNLSPDQTDFSREYYRKMLLLDLDEDLCKLLDKFPQFA